MTTILIIVIILLLAYVVILHIRLDKRDMHIVGIEASMKEMRKIWNSNAGGNSETSGEKESDNIANKRFRDFLFKDAGNVNLYTHYTREKAVAEKIMSEGFFFETILYKTTEKITNDTVDLTYKHHMRKQYGENVMVMGISKELLAKCQLKIKNEEGLKKFFPEHLLSSVVKKNEEGISGYNLHPSYVKGYLNYITGEIVYNNKYNPYSDPTE